ncbi:His/Gly/Thr/Pro-type tRNA ligase C-terminal domain-containing protein [Marinifilum fragile]|uniref:His/Gly/Thr/Pro-type tRNA ligase C-terminal domain-containing protein n=1 Tax=Marinifilum fragile TaxID=570161 RepID=UPI001FE22EBD|nr:His/Gly/Thr/Pro-type tRNA ligase C-terminal domain-containing protein [Marinifilum fragile]
MSGVGISFGADRIYDVLEQMDKFPEETAATTKVLFINFGEKEELFCLPILSQLRANGINAEIYPASHKMKKQMTYANNKNIPYVIMVGESEMEEGVVSLKNMETGDQEKLTPEQLIEKLA